MKRLIWMIFITLLTAGVAAQTKVVERSAKKVPGWLNTAVEDKSGKTKRSTLQKRRVSKSTKTTRTKKR